VEKQQLESENSGQGNKVRNQKFYWNVAEG